VPVVVCVGLCVCVCVLLGGMGEGLQEPGIERGRNKRPLKTKCIQAINEHV